VDSTDIPLRYHLELGVSCSQRVFTFFGEQSLCLSRACLGKMIPFQCIKSEPKNCFLTGRCRIRIDEDCASRVRVVSPVARPDDVVRCMCESAPPVLSFAYVCPEPVLVSRQSVFISKVIRKKGQHVS